MQHPKDPVTIGFLKSALARVQLEHCMSQLGKTVFKQELQGIRKISDRLTEKSSKGDRNQLFLLMQWDLLWMTATELLYNNSEEDVRSSLWSHSGQ